MADYMYYDKDNKLYFDWDPEKDFYNQKEHGIAFIEAVEAFADPHRVIVPDPEHSKVEVRYYCLGKIHGRVATVRFTRRDKVTRIIGAGYWRKGRKRYETEV